ncbi:MAG: DUF1996 domain-containing protein [Pseudomonadota bacterium]
MRPHNKLSIFGTGILALSLSACGGSGGSDVPAAPIGDIPVTPTPVSAAFSVDIFNAATGFMIESGVSDQIRLSGYESSIRIVVHTPSETTQVSFALTDSSGAHCPMIDQFDTTQPFEFTASTPSAGGMCEYQISDQQTATANPNTERLSIEYVEDPAPPGSSDPEPAEKYVFTNGTNEASPYQVGATTTRDAHGNRIYCVISHFSYDDPIIFPDGPGLAHLHMFWGNTATDAFTTSESILSSGAGSCEGGVDYRVGAWIPAVFNARDEVVVPEETFIYYKTFGGPSMRYDLVQEIPQGLGMLASADTLNFNDALIRAGFSDHNGWQALSLNVSFPSCVATENGQRDGRPILSYRDMPGEAANQVNSHVAYPGDGNEVDCPLSHPYRFPTPQFIMFFDAEETGTDPYLSSDAMAGAAPMSTLHGDYMFGASAAVNEDILRCVREARSCGFEGGRGQLPERFFGPDGQIYENSVSLANGVDRTPFGDRLTPLLTDVNGSSKVSHHHMHHKHNDYGASDFASLQEASLDVFSVENDRWLATVRTGSMLHQLPDGDTYFELRLPQHVSDHVGSAELTVNEDVVSVDNQAPFRSIEAASLTDRTGARLIAGENRVRARLYEQNDLGGSYLGEVSVVFVVHPSDAT